MDKIYWKKKDKTKPSLEPDKIVNNIYTKRKIKLM